MNFTANGFLRELGKYAVAGLLAGGVGGGVGGNISGHVLQSRIDAIEARMVVNEGRMTTQESRVEKIGLTQAAAIAKREADYAAIVEQLREIKDELKALRMAARK